MFDSPEYEALSENTNTTSSSTPSQIKSEICEPIGSGMAAAIERDNTPASSDEENGKEDEEFEVEQILDTRMSGKKRQFKVRWKNYGPEWDIWEPEDSLKDGAEESMKEFMIKYDAEKQTKKSKSRKHSPAASSSKPTRFRRSPFKDVGDESLTDTVSSSDGEGFTSSSKNKIKSAPHLLSGCSSSSSSEESSISHPPSTPAKNDSSVASTSSTTTTTSLSPTTKEHQKKMNHIKQNLDVQMFKAFTEQLARVPQMIEEVEKNEKRKKEKKEKKKVYKQV